MRKTILILTLFLLMIGGSGCGWIPVIGGDGTAPIDYKSAVASGVWWSGQSRSACHIGVLMGDPAELQSADGTIRVVAPPDDDLVLWEAILAYEDEVYVADLDEFHVSGGFFGMMCLEGCIVNDAYPGEMQCTRDGLPGDLSDFGLPGCVAYRGTMDYDATYGTTKSTKMEMLFVDQYSYATGWLTGDEEFQWVDFDFVQAPVGTTAPYHIDEEIQDYWINDIEFGFLQFSPSEPHIGQALHDIAWDIAVFDMSHTAVDSPLPFHTQDEFSWTPCPE